MTDHFTAFEGQRRLTAGALADVAMAVKRAESQRDAEPILIFSDATGRAIDLDLRGDDDAVLARLPQPGPTGATAEAATQSEPRGRGRPKLGVVAREVTLLPRHWEWLNTQPGGASVALRKLVEAARRHKGDADRLRAARGAAHPFILADGRQPRQFRGGVPCAVRRRPSALRGPDRGLAGGHSRSCRAARVWQRCRPIDR